MGIFMCLEYRFCKSVNSNSIHDTVPFLGQLICYSLIIERKQPTYSGGKSHASCVLYSDFPICSVVRTYENEQCGGRRGRRRW